MKLFSQVWDADSSTFTKIISVLSVLFGIFCVLWLVVASYGVGNTLLAQAHKAGHGGSETLFATLIFAATGFWIWINVTDRIPFRVSAVAFAVITLVLLVIGVNANTGFFGHVY